MATGWGNKSWGASEWGDLSDETVLTSSVAISSSIGSSTTQANSDVVVSGIAASYILPGIVAGASALVLPSGISLSAVIGNDSATPIGQNVSVTGIASTTGITAATIDDLGLIGSGWGRDLWGSMVWGDAYSVQTGSVSAQTAITGVTTQANADVQAQGQSLTVVTGDEVPKANANVFPDGITLTTDIGEVQALRLQGIEISTAVGLVDLQAGGNVYLQVDEHTLNTGIGSIAVEISTEVDVEGIQLNTFIGDEEAFTDVTVSPVGNALSIAEPEIVVDLNTPVDVTGSSLAIAIGDETTFIDVTVGVTGTSMTYAFGDVVIESKYSVDGINLSGAINSVTIDASAVVTPTGIGLTITVASPNIIAWAEVDVGTPVTWSPVDLAA